MKNRNHLAVSARTFWTALVVLALVSLSALRWQTSPRHCPPEEHAFAGQTYDIEVCSMGGDDFHALLRLRVYSRQGELLAQRSFTQLKVPGADTSLNTLDFQPSQITYSDAEPSDRDHIPPEYALKMPPSWWDWVTANISRLLWT